MKSEQGFALGEPGPSRRQGLKDSGVPRLQLPMELRRRLRPEFSGGLIVGNPTDPLWRGTACAVVGCPGVAIGRQLCGGHAAKKRRQAPHEDIDEWARSQDPHLIGRGKPLTKCVVADCRRGGNQRGLCATHHAAFRREGIPNSLTMEQWLPSARPHAKTRPDCALPGCELESEGSAGWCKSHDQRWRSAGSPPTDEFIESC